MRDAAVSPRLRQAWSLLGSLKRSYEHISTASVAWLEWAVKLCYTITTYMLPRANGQSDDWS